MPKYLSVVIPVYNEEENPKIRYKSYKFIHTASSTLLLFFQILITVSLNEMVSTGR